MLQMRAKIVHGRLAKCTLVSPTRLRPQGRGLRSGIAGDSLCRAGTIDASARRVERIRTVFSHVESLSKKEKN